MSTEISLKNAQPQGIEREFREHSQNSQIIQQNGQSREGEVQQQVKAAVHSDLREDSQNLLRMTSVPRNTETFQKTSFNFTNS